MLKGISVKQAARELNTSERTIFRMLEDGRLEGRKFYLPFGKEKYIWEVSPVSVAKLLLQKEASGKKHYWKNKGVQAEGEG